MSNPVVNSGDEQIKIKQSPWVKIETKNECSLEEVMSEQLAQNLAQQEGYLNSTEALSPQTTTTTTTQSDSQTDTDFLLAQLLQLEFDKEFDELLKASERIKNRDSRVEISFDKFKSVHPINVKDEKEINESTKIDIIVGIQKIKTKS